MAIDGTLTLDADVVQAGTPILGVLSDFAQWPAGLIGGGSGETFLSCAPWLPLGDAEALVTTADVGLFLLDVPAGTPPGTYAVSVVFFEGPEAPPGERTFARLSASVTVTSEPVDAVAGPACALPGAPAPRGSLTGDDAAVVGGALTVGLTDLGDAARIYFDEYDTLWAVACFDGRAVPVRQDLAAAPASVRLPVGATPGPSTLRLGALLDGALVWWERVVTVTAAPEPPPAAPTVEVSAPSCTTVSVAGSGWAGGGAVAVAVVDSRGAVVAGPVSVLPDAAGAIAPAAVALASPPSGTYWGAVLVDGVERARSVGFALRGCRPELPATGPDVGLAGAALALGLLGLACVAWAQVAGGRRPTPVRGPRLRGPGAR
ncbi:hypothetical protein [Actinotalea solisilvae]|uniref:hypothetical protein n=1 Tax=Actinotalea solisilvae TaxID=2072922 RepID=UPI0018F1BBDD|nr:hypothetical protein [Actinotalea solisilvae]